MKISAAIMATLKMRFSCGASGLIVSHCQNEKKGKKGGGREGKGGRGGGGEGRGKNIQLMG